MAIERDVIPKKGRRERIKGKELAGTTGLEPATSDVTGRRSNQLSYVPAMCRNVFYINMRFRMCENDGCETESCAERRVRVPRGAR